MKKVKITSSERALSIIKSPIMTEKSTNLNQFNKYSFFVAKKSNSLEINIPEPSEVDTENIVSIIESETRKRAGVEKNISKNDLIL